MCRRLVPLTGGLVLLCAASLCAQEAALEQTFGSGVHSYFSGEYQEAFDLLNQAVEAGSPDPRCCYFRGLCYMQLGREDEAKQDFEKGAELETLDLNRFFDVARSLERIQGHQRMLLESYRAKARMAALKREQERRQRRYEVIRQQETRVLQQQAAQAAAELPPAAGTPAPGAPFGLAPIEAVEAADVEPPAAVAAPAAPAPAEMPAAPAADDPFSAAPHMEPVIDSSTTPASAEVPLEKGAGSRIMGAFGHAVGKALTGSEDKPDAPALDAPAMEAPAADPFAPDAPAPPAPAAPANDAPPPAPPAPANDAPPPASAAKETPAADPFADDAPPPAAPANDAPAAAPAAMETPAADPFADDAPPPAAPANDAPAAVPVADEVPSPPPPAAP